MTNSEHYTVEELLNPESFKLMRWYAERKLHHTVIRQCAIRGHDTDDIIQRAAMMLLRSKMGRKYSWTTYCCKSVHYAASHLGRERLKNRPSMLQIDDMMPHPSFWESDPLTSATAKELLAVLTERERDVINKRFGIGCTPVTFSEIAGGLGVSKQRVEQIERAAIQKMAEV